MTNEELQRLNEQADRLLQPYYNGIAEGKQRAIKLLEKQMEDCCSYGPSACLKCGVIAESIALIKVGPSE